MRSDRSPRIWPRLAVCSVWPLVVPALWYGSLLRNVHHANSPEVLASLPEASRAGAARLTASLEAMLVPVAIKFLVVMFLLSAATCAIAAKRMRAGASWRRAVADVAIVTLAVGALAVMTSAFRGDVSLSLVEPQPTEHFWPALFPPWCALAAGLSFIITFRRGGFVQDVA